MAIAVPPPPPGVPKEAPKTQKTSDIIGTFRTTKQFKFSKSTTAVTSLDFDDSGEYALAACDDESLQLYSAKEGKHLKQLLSQKYGAHLARFTHHSSSIIYASTKVDDGIRYLSTHDNAFLRYFKGHTKAVTSIAVCPASDTFMSCSLDDTVRLWDLKSPSPQGRLNLTTPHLAAYDPSATVIAIASYSTCSILMYDLRNFHQSPFLCFDIQPLLPKSYSFAKPSWTRLEFSNDGKTILLGTNDASAGHLILDAFTGNLKAFCTRKSQTGSGSHAPSSQPDMSHSRAAPGCTGAPGQGDVCFTSDGRYLIGGTGEASDAFVWDTHAQHEVETMQLKPLYRLPSKSRTSVVGYNPRYNMIASGDRELLFWLPDEHVGQKAI